MASPPHCAAGDGCHSPAGHPRERWGETRGWTPGWVWGASWQPWASHSPPPSTRASVPPGQSRRGWAPDMGAGEGSCFCQPLRATVTAPGSQAPHVSPSAGSGAVLGAVQCYHAGRSPSLSQPKAPQHAPAALCLLQPPDVTCPGPSALGRLGETAPLPPRTRSGQTLADSTWRGADGREMGRYLLGARQGCFLELVVAVLGIRADRHPCKREQSRASGCAVEEGRAGGPAGRLQPGLGTRLQSRAHAKPGPAGVPGPLRTLQAGVWGFPQDRTRVSAPGAGVRVCPGVFARTAMASAGL